ncbi:MAG: DUF6473 family protein [Pseudooceanicola sp.]
MTYETWGAGALDYFACRYGESRNRFRGPKRKLEGEYLAFLGGTDTYGRFIPRPYPALVEDRLGIPCVNFGWANAGIDAFMHDLTVLEAARAAKAVVLQVPGAQNMSNRYYAVHPRRNDRFLQASGLMRKVFPNTDFTEFHFTRHLLNKLRRTDVDRFAILVAELQFAWVARMGEFLSLIDVPVILLWFSDHAPESDVKATAMEHDPLFVTDEMLASVEPRPLAILDATASANAIAAGTLGMVFSEVEAPAAGEALGPAAHEEAAEKLAPVLADLIHLL